MRPWRERARHRSDKDKFPGRGPPRPSSSFGRGTAAGARRMRSRAALLDISVGNAHLGIAGIPVADSDRRGIDELVRTICRARLPGHSQPMPAPRKEPGSFVGSGDERIPARRISVQSRSRAISGRIDPKSEFYLKIREIEHDAGRKPLHTFRHHARGLAGQGKPIHVFSVIKYYSVKATL